MVIGNHPGSKTAKSTFSTCTPLPSSGFPGISGVTDTESLLAAYELRDNGFAGFETGNRQW